MNGAILNKLSNDIAALSPRQRALLEMRLKEKLGSARQTRISRQSSTASHFPLSFAQERLWFIDQLEPGTVVYNLFEAVRITGPLNVSALKESLDQVVRRHEILRTTFAIVGGRPAQTVAASLMLVLPRIDVQGVSRVDRNNELHRIASLEAVRSFDLAGGPLLRVSLVRLDELEHVLLFTIHHIISDGLSLRILVNEVASCYDALTGGKPLTLADLPIQYADFAVWQRRRMESGAFEDDFSYWKKLLAGAPPLLEFINSRPRAAIQTHFGAKRSFAIQQGVAERIRALSRQEGVTTFMLLLAAFNALLCYHTGRFDILVGSPVASINRSEIEGMIGLFVNIVVLRTDLTNDPGFKELLRRTRDVVLDGLAHQEAPFERLVEELRLERNLSYNPLFQVAFALDHVSATAIKLSDIEIEYLEIESQSVQFDMVLHLVDTGKELTGALQYNTSLFEPPVAGQILEDYQMILSTVAAAPHVRLSELTHSLARAHEQQALEKRRELGKINAMNLKSVKRKPISGA